MQTAVATKIFNGRELRDILLAQVQKQVQAMPPVNLTIVQVGDNPASSAYVKAKLQACAKIGIVGEHVHLHRSEDEAAFHSIIHGLAHNPEVHGIIVQTPLPAAWDTRKALDMVPAAKDVDGLTSANRALRLARKAEAILPATPLGVMRILGFLNQPIKGQKIAVIGRGMVVGAPLREILAMAGAEVVKIDRDTLQPARLCRECEVIVAATGVAELVTANWLKPGAVVVDVGITRQGNRLIGDVKRMDAEGLASVVTPVPGGVGPMTVASLMTNTVDAACLQLGRQKIDWRLDVGA